MKESEENVGLFNVQLKTISSSGNLELRSEPTFRIHLGRNNFKTFSISLPVCH